MIWWATRLGATGLLLGLVNGCSGGIPGANQTPDNQDQGDQQQPGQLPAAVRHPALYTSGNPFAQRLPTNPGLAPNSTQLVGSIIEAAAGGFVIAWRSWAIPVFYADASTPRYDVALTADWAPVRLLREVPIPDFAQPDPEDDGHLVVIDEASGCEYDFWQMRRVGNGWQASWGNSLKITGSGVFPTGFSCRGSGFALLNGVLWPDELAAGRIDHALGMIYNFCRAGGPVAPATESDGEVTRADAIPEGARIQLDPALDIDTLGLPVYARTIAVALQKYGFILVDSGGAVSLQAVSPLSAAGNPYVGLLPDEEFPDLSGIPVDRLRVLTLPPQNPHPTIALSPVGCGVFE